MTAQIERYLYLIQQVGSRYYFVAGIAFFFFYILFRSRIQHRKIQIKFPSNRDYWREIFYSSFTIFLFALVPYFLVFNPAVRPYTQLYSQISERGWLYYFALFPILFFIHDTYFYWIHRLMHHPVLFRWFHLVHHRSTNPSPWAAYAFHPLEAFLEVGIFALFLFLFPIHRTHILLFFLLSIIYNVYGHLGWELYPKGFNHTWVGRWINTSVAHNQHHKYFTGNYGLYFLFWDRWMGTLRSEYDTSFEEVTSREK
jgi:sterol desaturase/sphingolipid hydroxylase (fatty acid hydroxylase superfamily)